MPSIAAEKKRQAFAKRTFSGVSGIHKLTDEGMKDREKKAMEIAYLESQKCETVTLPKTQESHNVDLDATKVDCHEVNEENFLSIGKKLVLPTGGTQNPYFNKKLMTTQHGVYLNPISLYKMGQIGEDDLVKELGKIQETMRKNKPDPKITIAADLG